MSPRLLRAADTVERTDTGRQRRGNEDSSYAHAPLFVIADGMGGAQAGEVASHLAVQQFEQGLPGDGPSEQRLSEAVQRANQEIYELSQTDASRAGMGTTLTAAYLDSDHVAIAHVGDSRAYLLRDGELTRLTEDHSLVEELLKKGKLTEEEALEHPQRSVITRALGIEPVVEVDTWSYLVRPGDVLLLCSDGLTSMIAEGAVQRVLVESQTLRAAADRLIAEANEAGGRDNITVILFRVEEIGDGDSLDQPTTVSHDQVISAPVDERGSAVSGQVATAPRTARGAAASSADRLIGPGLQPRARLARTQGWTRRGDHERHFGKFGKFVAGLVAASVVLFFILAGGYLASRQLYFLGTNGQGTVVVYRGFPYVLPFGVPMYETFYVSGVPASALPADRRSTLLNHDLRSQAAAQKLINTLELGKISG
jgi:serine/threonine protein phosphatase PrpC